MYFVTLRHLLVLSSNPVSLQEDDLQRFPALFSYELCSFYHIKGTGSISNYNLLWPAQKSEMSKTFNIRDMGKTFDIGHQRHCKT